MPACGHCERRLEIVANQVGRRDVCPGCEEPLRSCRNCRHRDPAATRECREPFAELPADPDAANFCEYFQLGEGGLTAGRPRAALLEAAEALFKKD